jgi:hypothetical protein
MLNPAEAPDQVQVPGLYNTKSAWCVACRQLKTVLSDSSQPAAHQVIL